MAFLSLLILVAFVHNDSQGLDELRWLRLERNDLINQGNIFSLHLGAMCKAVDGEAETFALQYWIAIRGA